MAIIIAATAVVASKPVTNFPIFLPPTIFTGLPSTRTTVARHLPGFPSNGWTQNCLYSTPDLTGKQPPVRLRCRDVGRATIPAQAND
jgi:hypothetical protein